MERYFIVTEKSSLHEEWFNYKENRREVRDLFAKVREDQGIDSEEFYVTNEHLYIVPTDKDLEKYASVLCSPINDNLQKFKGNSKIGKSWVNALKEAELKVLYKPRLIFYIKHEGGKYRSRLFDVDGVIYCSIDPCQSEVPKGFIEIKGSEFFKVIEDAEKSAV